MPLLRQALKDKPPPEVRRHVEGLIATMTDASMASDRLGTLRAVDVLEKPDASSDPDDWDHRLVAAVRKVKQVFRG